MGGPISICNGHLGERHESAIRRFQRLVFSSDIANSNEVSDPAPPLVFRCGESVFTEMKRVDLAYLVCPS